MMDPDHQSLDPDPELESPDIPKRVEIRLRSRIQGRNRNTSSHGVHIWSKLVSDCHTLPAGRTRS